MITRLFTAYLRQQKQLGVDDYILNKDLINLLSLKRVNTTEQTTASLDSKTNQQAAATAIKEAVKNVVSQKKAESSSVHTRLASLRPLNTIIPSAQVGSKTVEPPVLEQSKREALKQLYINGCNACHLASSRNRWVFGAGNAEAIVMVIGEAPGAEEDEQGLPFVGAAGQLLTNMLAAINLNRNKDIFITNVLKCRPPANRSPESAEIQLCTPLLCRQIEIIKPRAILLLGRIAAHAVLGISESIAKLRSKVHDYNGIPAMVIYHPAALLRNAQYKRPAWEDLQKFQALLENLGVYGLPK
ncbi:MAG: uracil-DNA glycosylase [Fibrobacter sp.]|jgi:DNA polymerase|nr:uracil-DNA glycosylase [Fibrobacter sp.]